MTGSCTAGTSNTYGERWTFRERILNFRAYRFGDTFSMWSIRVRKHYDEFFAAISSRAIAAAPHMLCNALSKVPQRAVALSVTVSVVILLEMIGIDVQN
jgi:hypothetical protein